MINYIWHCNFTILSVKSSKKQSPNTSFGPVFFTFILFFRYKELYVSTRLAYRTYSFCLCPLFLQQLISATNCCSFKLRIYATGSCSFVPWGVFWGVFCTKKAPRMIGTPIIAALLLRFSHFVSCRMQRVFVSAYRENA